MCELGIFAIFLENDLSKFHKILGLIFFKTRGDFEGFKRRFSIYVSSFFCSTECLQILLVYSSRRGQFCELSVSKPENICPEIEASCGERHKKSFSLWTWELPCLKILQRSNCCAWIITTTTYNFLTHDLINGFSSSPPPPPPHWGSFLILLSGFKNIYLDFKEWLLYIFKADSCFWLAVRSTHVRFAMRIWTTVGPFMWGKIRRVLHIGRVLNKTPTFRINDTFRLK